MKENQSQKKKLILHIGQSKTGTTSFQAVVHRNRDALLQANLAYPNTGLRFSNHTYLAMHYLGTRNDDALIEDLRVEIRDTAASCVLISCEAFEGLSARQASKLVQDLDEFELYLLCSLRGRLAWATSMYAEFAKKAWFTDSFETLLYSHDSNAPTWRRAAIRLRLSRRSNHIARHFHHLLRDSHTLGQWCQLLPEDRICLVEATDASLWKQLKEKFDLAIDNEISSDGRTLNRSPTVLAVEMARRYYSSAGRQDLPYPLAMRFLARIDRELLSQNMADDANCYFDSHEQATAFLDRYISEDSWLQNNFGFSRRDDDRVSELVFLQEADANERFRSLETDIANWFFETESRIQNLRE